MAARLLFGALAAALAAAGALALAGEKPAPEAAPGVPVSGGAAPGYVPDRACGACHADLWRSYQEVAMARSFYAPDHGPAIEDFAALPFFHEPSRQYFEIRRQGGRLVFRRFELDTEKRPVHVFEVGIEWILGSGNHARTYLYRTPDGALFQLPLAWYSQEGRWGMAPGFDRPDHDGVLRRVRRECLFCHNGYPEVSAGSDAGFSPHTFPAALPEGTGCQRCHGPGAEHVRRASGGIESGEEIRAAIVNPARLSAERRDDVCNQCHLQPVVALSGARRLGRGDYSFRPGEALADYQVHVDVTEEGVAPGERFEINHHAYRLRQSLCFTASAGRLSCSTCHDPHRRVPAAERAAHFRAACLTCHAARPCRRPGRELAIQDGADMGDCATCHMPRRRPTDVVRVVMTDHRITRRVPDGPALLAPLAETDPQLTGVHLLEPARLTPAAAAEVYRTLPVVRSGISAQAVDHLERLVAQSGAGVFGPELRLELAVGQLRQRRYAASIRSLEEALRHLPETGRTLEMLGLAREGLGQLAEAEAALRAALVRQDAETAEVAFRLGQLLARQGRHREAVPLYERAVALRPNLALAWLRLGQSRWALGEKKEAVESFERALAADPTLGEAAASLARTGP